MQIVIYEENHISLMRWNVSVNTWISYSKAVILLAKYNLPIHGPTSVMSYIQVDW